MTEIKIEQIVWDEWNAKHINKHNVTQEEVEEVVTTIITHKKGYSGRVLLIGIGVKKQTGEKYRFLIA